MSWSQEKQNQLNRLIKEKEEFELERFNTVANEVRDWGWNGMSIEEMTQALIANASSIRKVLKPFDFSGNEE
jgi:hypothetical protein